MIDDEKLFFLMCHISRGQIRKSEFHHDEIIAIAMAATPLADHIVALSALQ